MAVFASDTFTDTSGTLLSSHTGEVGATWTQHGSSGQTMKITDANMCRGTGTGGYGIYYASGVPATAEYDVQALVTQRSTSSNPIGVVGRVDTAAHTMYFVLYDPSDGSFQLHKLVTGTDTQLSTSYVAAIGNGNSVTVLLQIRDAAKKVFVNGVERISSTDNAITAAGRAGVRGKCGGDNNTTAAHLDTFVATDLSSPSHIGKLALLGVGLYVVAQPFVGAALAVNLGEVCD